MAQILGSLLPMEEIRIKFLAPGFGLVQPLLLWASGDGKPVIERFLSNKMKRFKKFLKIKICF